MDPKEYRYKAFVSHSAKDYRTAQLVIRDLERFRVPRALVGSSTEIGVVRQGLGPIFSDRLELAASSDLSSSLSRAIEESQFLIVICSPRAAQSEWVNKEIETFCKLGKGERMLFVLAEGEINESFPPAAQRANIEPLFVDLRSSSDRKLVTIKLASAMLGVSSGELFSRRERLQRRRVIIFSLPVLIGLIGVIAAVAVVQRSAESYQRTRAELVDAKRKNETLQSLLLVGSNDPDSILKALDTLKVDVEFLPSVVNLIEHPDKRVSSHAAAILAKIVKDISVSDFDIVKLKEFSRQLVRAEGVLTSAAISSEEVALVGAKRDEIDRKIEKESKPKFDWYQRAWAFLSDTWKYKPVQWGGLVGGYFLSCTFGWLLIERTRPLWIHNLSKSFDSIKFEIPKIGVTVSLNGATLLSFFRYREKVLDGWVDAHIEPAQENIEKHRISQDRTIHIPVPAYIDEEREEVVSLRTLRSVFEKKRFILLVWGGGGVGKTSLTCLITRLSMMDKSPDRICPHRMIPVVVDGIQGMGKSAEISLVKHVQGVLAALVESSEELSSGFVEALLRNKRLLLVVDGFSEMGEGVRKIFDPASNEFPAAAVVVTSRVQEDFEGAPKTTLRPSRLNGDGVMSFIRDYHDEIGKDHLFSQSEFQRSADQLSSVVGGSEIPALVAKLYADEMIFCKEAGKIDSLPGTLPELFLRYLNNINRNRRQGDPSNPTVQHDLKRLAWLAVQEKFRAEFIALKDVMKELGKAKDADGVDAHDKARYYIERLGVLEIVGTKEDRLRFRLDPVAEYLAAIKVVESYGKNPKLWDDLFKRIESRNEKNDLIRGFLLALRHCCLQPEVSPPEFAIELLDSRLDSPVELKELGTKRLAIHKNTQLLKSEEAFERKHAIISLAKMGSSASTSIPFLIRSLRDSDSGVREAALDALEAIAGAPSFETMGYGLQL
ncbi:TIR domain-containing protein [Roseibacillus persicicus]|uniref:HEAT repeat domain-containing protein n=1 Tax=Roseibacillus persicicus TaxID=454148 RepID=UPI00398B92A6